MSKVPGVDFSSGSIGHALSNGAGMAVGARLGQRDFRVFVMLGDGEQGRAGLGSGAVRRASPAVQPDRHRRSQRLSARRPGRRRDRRGIAGRQVARLRLGRARGRRPRLSALTALLRRLRADGTRGGLRDRPHRQGQGRCPIWKPNPAGTWATWPRPTPMPPSPKSCPARSEPPCRNPSSTPGRTPDRHPRRAPRILAVPRAQCGHARPVLSVRRAHRSDARRPSVVAGSADLQYSNGLNRYASAFPERYVQFGISEQNMVSAAAGMATTG